MTGVKNICIACAMLATCFVTHAQDNFELTVEEIIDQVETEYPLVLQYDSRIRSLQSKADGSSSWMPPSFSFGLNSFPYQLELIRQKDDPMNWSGLMFSAEQMIPNLSKLTAKRSYYLSQKDVQLNNAEWTKNILRAQVKTLYYHRLVAERKLGLFEESRDLLNLFITISESHYTYNQADLSTIFKAKAKLKELDNMATMAKAEITESNIGLNALLNRPTDTPFEIDTVVVIKHYDSVTFIQGPDTYSVERSDINSMSSKIRSMELNRKWMATGRRPDFGLRVSHMDMFSMPDQFSVMGMITIPIAPWSSKMYKTEVQSMTYEIQAMTREREAMKLMATRMINEKLAMFKYERQQFEAFEDEIIPSYRKNLDANLVSYKQNTGNFFVLLDAWEMLLMKRIEQFEKLGLLLRLQTEYEYETER